MDFVFCFYTDSFRGLQRRKSCVEHRARHLRDIASFHPQNSLPPMSPKTDEPSEACTVAAMRSFPWSVPPGFAWSPLFTTWRQLGGPIRWQRLLWLGKKALPLNSEAPKVLALRCDLELLMVSLTEERTFCCFFVSCLSPFPLVSISVPGASAVWVLADGAGSEPPWGL